MNLNYEDETDWTIELGDFLTDRDITYTDVTEITLLVKQDLTDLDASALMTKKLSLSEIAFVDACTVQVVMASTDFGSGKLIVDGSYLVSIGFSAPSYTGVLVEMDLKDNTLIIKQDGIRA